MSKKRVVIRRKSNSFPIANHFYIDVQQLYGLEGRAGFQIVEELDNFDKEITDYYRQSNIQGLEEFNIALNLLVTIKLAINQKIKNFSPRFRRNSGYSKLLDISICGVIRNLRIVEKLMLTGYFLESHATLRMVQQWLETELIIESNPLLADRILKLGSYKKLPKKDKDNAINSKPEIKQIHSGMMKTFGRLSERTHVTKTAIDLSTFSNKELGEISSFSGIIQLEMLEKDSAALATMANNALSTIVRHFSKVPIDWEQTRLALKQENR